MKYIDIKKDALRLMGVIPSTVQNEYDTSNTVDYMVSMNNSIMRAIDRMKTLELIPPKIQKIADVNKSGFCTYTCGELGITKNVKRVLKVEGVSFVEVPFTVIDDTISVYLEKGELYCIEYIVEFVADFSDEAEIDIPDELARLIPYFIKADLYEEEEPSLSLASRNIFEGYLQEYAYNHDFTVRSVKVVHKL